ncbi:MAG: hypothetical protein RhofKO_22580 [Rhodothermales bacterium]
MLHLLQRGSVALALTLILLLASAPNLLAQTTIALDGGGNLVITDTANKNDDLDVSLNLADIVITDANGAILTTAIPGAIGSGTNSVSFPLATVTGTEIQFVLSNGNDAVTYSAVPKVVSITADVLDLKASAYLQNLSVAANTLTVSGNISNPADVTLRGANVTINAALLVSGNLSILQPGNDVTSLTLITADGNFINAGTAVSIGDAADGGDVTLSSSTASPVVLADVPVSVGTRGTLTINDPVVASDGAPTTPALTVTLRGNDVVVHAVVLSEGPLQVLQPGDGATALNLTTDDPSNLQSETSIIVGDNMDGGDVTVTSSVPTAVVIAGVPVTVQSMGDVTINDSVIASDGAPTDPGLTVTIRGNDVTINGIVIAEGPLQVLQPGDGTTALNLTTDDPSNLQSETSITIGDNMDGGNVSVTSSVPTAVVIDSVPIIVQSLGDVTVNDPIVSSDGGAPFDPNLTVIVRGNDVLIDAIIAAEGPIRVLQPGDDSTPLNLTVSDPSFLDSDTEVELGTIDDAAKVTVLSPVATDVALSARGGGDVSTVALFISTANPLVIQVGEDGNGSDNKLFGPYETTGGTITILAGTGDDVLHLYVQATPITPTVDAGDGTDDIHIHGDPNAATNESFTIAANLFEGPGISFDPVGGEILIAKGMEGDDDLTVDFAGGDPVPAGGEVIFQGFDGADFLTLVNGTVTTIDHTFTNASDGSIDIDGSVVSYTGLAPVFDNLSSTDRIFRFGATDDEVTLDDDANPSDGVSMISSNGTSETVWFVNPTNSITVLLDDGNDQLDHDIDGLFAGTFSFEGGDGDDTYRLEDQDETTAHTYDITSTSVMRDAAPYVTLDSFVSVRVSGGDQADLFNLTPSADASFDIRGGDPNVAVGDQLDVEFAGITGETLTPGGAGAGTWTFGSGELDVTYQEIETLLDLSNLEVTKAVTAFPSPFPGDFVTFEVVVTNNGPDDATNLIITDTLPAELVYLMGTASTTAGAFVVNPGPPETIVWDGFNLTNGASATLTFEVVAASAFAGTFANLATISSKDQGDIDTSDNTDDADVDVQAAPRLPANRHPQAVAYWTSANGDVYPLVGTMNHGMYRGIPQNYVPGGVGSYFTEANTGLTIPLFITDLFVSPTSNEVLLCSWGRNGLYRSDDGGQSWTQGVFQDMLGNTGGSFNICYAIVEGLGGILYASADRGRFLRSFDNGLTWQFVGTLPRASSDTPWSLAAHPIEANRVIAGTFGRGILVSNDMGETWTEPLNNGLPSSAGHIFDMEYAPLTMFGGDPTLIIATGDGIYFSSDDGDNWLPLDTGLPAGGTPEVRSIAFDSNEVFYAAVWGFGVYSSDDVENFGANPFGQLMLKGTQITDLIINPVTGGLLLASQDAGIVSSEDTSTRVSVDEPDAELPTEIALEQNYPNPFNPVTTIGYSLPQSSAVRIVVYDALGRVVQTLVDGTQPAGTHTVTFDAANLPSGVYLYRLETPAQNITRQLTLMK